jgi:hypothetical protein
MSWLKLYQNIDITLRALVQAYDRSKESQLADMILLTKSFDLVRRYVD